MRELIYSSKQITIYSDSSLEWHGENYCGVYEGTWRWNSSKKYFEMKIKKEWDWEPMIKRYEEAIEGYIRKVIES